MRSLNSRQARAIASPKREANQKNLPIFWNYPFDKGRLKSFISWFLKQHGEKKTLELLEQLKILGFGYATIAGISLGIEDLKIPPQKMKLLAKAQHVVAQSRFAYKQGKITGIEKMQGFIETWNEVNETLKDEVVSYFEKTDVLNPVYMIAFSGARGNLSQVRQLVGMRGLMSDPQGKIIDFPILSNFREGLTLTEYLISTYGARKGIVDTALRTATAGYLTRRLVDVAQHVIVSKFDCETRRGIFLFDMKDGIKTIYSFQNRLTGRVLAQDIFNSADEINDSLESNTKGSNQVLKNWKVSSEFPLAKRNQEIDATLASLISKVTKKALVRSPLTCETRKLVCQLCYGWSLATSRLVSIGEAVGVIAGQSIGEPGTQLTMRTFHTGGVFAGSISEQINAISNGWIEYSNPIAGSFVRLPQGNLAFLTKAPGTMILKPADSPIAPEISVHNSPEEVTNTNFSTLQQPKDNIKIYKNVLNKKPIQTYNLPPFTLLFQRHGEWVTQESLLAQVSSLTTAQKGTQISEQTIYSSFEGEIYYSHLDLMEDIEDKYGERISKSENWAKVWLLSAKIFYNPIGSFFFPKVGDRISKNSVIQEIQWMNPLHSSASPYHSPNIKIENNFSYSFQLKNQIKNKIILKAIPLKKVSLKGCQIQLNSSVFLSKKKNKMFQKSTIFQYTMPTNRRLCMIQELSEARISLPILQPGTLTNWLDKKAKKFSKVKKNVKSMLNHLNSLKLEKTVFSNSPSIVSLRLKNIFLNPTKNQTNLFHPLVLSNHIPFILNLNTNNYLRRSMQLHPRRDFDKTPSRPSIYSKFSKSQQFLGKTSKIDFFMTSFLTEKKRVDPYFSKNFKQNLTKVFSFARLSSITSWEKKNKDLVFSDNQDKLLNPNESLKRKTKDSFLFKKEKTERGVNFTETFFMREPLLKFTLSKQVYRKQGYRVSINFSKSNQWGDFEKNEKEYFFSFLPLEGQSHLSSHSRSFENLYSQNLRTSNFSKEQILRNIELKNTTHWEPFPKTSVAWYPQQNQIETSFICFVDPPVSFGSELLENFFIKPGLEKLKGSKQILAFQQRSFLKFNLAQSQYLTKGQKYPWFAFSDLPLNPGKSLFLKYSLIFKNCSSLQSQVSKFNYKLQQKRNMDVFLPSVKGIKNLITHNSVPKAFKDYQDNQTLFFNVVSKSNYACYLKLFSKKSAVIFEKLHLKAIQKRLKTKKPENLWVQLKQNQKNSVSFKEIFWLPQENYSCFGIFSTQIEKSYDLHFQNSKLTGNSNHKPQDLNQIENPIPIQLTTQFYNKYNKNRVPVYLTNLQGHKKELSFYNEGILIMRKHQGLPFSNKHRAPEIGKSQASSPLPLFWKPDFFISLNKKSSDSHFSNISLIHNYSKGKSNSTFDSVKLNFLNYIRAKYSNGSKMKYPTNVNLTEFRLEKTKIKRPNDNLNQFFFVFSKATAKCFSFLPFFHINKTMHKEFGKQNYLNQTKQRLPQEQLISVAAPRLFGFAKERSSKRGESFAVPPRAPGQKRAQRIARLVLDKRDKKNDFPNFRPKATEMLEIHLKSGWVYISFNSLNSFVNKKFISDIGEKLLDDIQIDQTKVLIEPISQPIGLDLTRHQKNYVKENCAKLRFLNQIKPNKGEKRKRFKTSYWITPKKSRFSPFENSAKFSSKKFNFYLFRPFNSQISSSNVEMKIQLEEAMKKRQMTQIGTSFLFYENYFSLELNEQKADLKIVSNFANLDFNLNRMSIFSNPSLTRSKSFQKNLKNRKKVLAKISDCSKYSKPKNKDKKNQSGTFTDIHLSFRKKFALTQHSLQNLPFFLKKMATFKKSTRLSLYFSNNVLNTSPFQIMSDLPNSETFSFPGISLNQEKNTILLNPLSLETSKPFVKNYLSLLLQRQSKKFTKTSTNNAEVAKFDYYLKNKKTNNPATVKHLTIKQSSLEVPQKFQNTRILLPIFYSLPSLEFYICQNYNFFLNHKLLGSFDWKQSFENSKKVQNLNSTKWQTENFRVQRFFKKTDLQKNFVSFYNLPASKNFLFLKNKKFQKTKAIGSTRFYSPYNGIVLKDYSEESNNSIRSNLKKAFNIHLDNALFEDRQAQKLILTKQDLFTLTLGTPLYVSRTSRPSGASSSIALGPSGAKEEREENQESIIDQDKSKQERDFNRTRFKVKTFTEKQDFFEQNETLAFLKLVVQAHENFKTLQQESTEKGNFKNYAISNFSTNYENKTYKLKNVVFGLPKESNKLFIGNFFYPGDRMYDHTCLSRSGQLIHLNLKKATFRKAEFFSLSPKAILHTYNGHCVPANSPVMTLPFETLKTGDIVQGIPKVEQYLEARTTIQGRLFLNSLPVLLYAIYKRYLRSLNMEKAVRQSLLKIQQILVDGVQRVYRSQGVGITDKHLEVIVRQMTSKVKIVYGGQTGFFQGELVELDFVERVNRSLMVKIIYEPIVLGITRASLEVDSFLSAASFQQTTKVLTRSALENKRDFLKGLKENLLVGNLIPAGTGYVVPVFSNFLDENK